MNSSLIKENWRSRGYSFGVFQDPPKQVWANFVHKTDELVVLAEGEIEIVIEGKGSSTKNWRGSLYYCQNFSYCEKYWIKKEMFDIMNKNVHKKI